MHKAILPLVFILLATSASAQSNAQLDRAISAFAGIEAKMHAFYLSASQDFAPHLVSVAREPEMHGIIKCVLSRIAEADGANALRTYLDGLEMQAAQEIVSLSTMSEDLPDIMTSDTVMSASLACGGATYMQKKQMTDGFMEVMQRPEVQSYLINGAAN